MAIETKDLWQSAYLLTEGGWLSRVKVNRRADGRREVVFELTGEGMEDLARRFISGQAVCNVTKLKAQVNHLKDVIFGGAVAPLGRRLSSELYGEDGGAHSGVGGESCGVSNGD